MTPSLNRHPNNPSQLPACLSTREVTRPKRVNNRRSIWTKFLLFVSVIFVSLPSRAKFNDNTIYGDDDRRDLYQIQDPRLLLLADSTVALFQSYKVAPGPEGGIKLESARFGEEMGLCPGEAFFDQPTGAFCSGSLVGPDLIMTAGHCVLDQASCRDTKFVFGFAVKKEGSDPTTAPAGEVYGCAQLLGRAERGTGADWALVRLNRRVAGHAALEINRSGAITDGTSLVVIGHPSGLPTKIAGNAIVRSAKPEGYFVANTDTFAGNSGSAVFNAKTGLVEGILVRGEEDFEAHGSCRVAKRCPANGCRGEDVTRISALAERIPQKSEATARLARPDSSLAQLLRAASEPRP